MADEEEGEEEAAMPLDERVRAHVSALASLEQLDRNPQTDTLDARTFEQLADTTGSAEARGLFIAAEGVPLLIRLLRARCLLPSAAPGQSWPTPPPLTVQLLRALRNLCAGSPTTQRLLVAEGVLAAAFRLADRCAAPPPGTPVADVAAAAATGRMALQLLGNTIAANAETAAAAWEVLFPAGFASLLGPVGGVLGAGSSGPSATTCAAMILQTCLAKDQDVVVAPRRRALADRAGGGAAVRGASRVEPFHVDGVATRSVNGVCAICGLAGYGGSDGPSDRAR